MTAAVQWCAITILASLCLCEASKILVVFPFPSKSHGILGAGYVRLLLEAGHEVTYIAPYPVQDSNPKLHQVDISSIIEAFPSGKLGNLKAIMDKDQSGNDIKLFFSLLLNLSTLIFDNENVQKMLNDPTQQFDLVIIEWMFSEIYVGLSAVYDCPYIWFSSVEPHWVVLQLIDEALNPAYNPDSLSQNLPPFTFKQRVQELMSQIAVAFFRNFYFLNIEKTKYNEVFEPIMIKKGRPLPSYDEIRFNASIMFGNSHVSMGRTTRLPQSYKAIGGYHIDPKVKPLPEDLKKLIESAKNGIIYFSMGSNLKSESLPDEVKRGLLKMFGGLKYTVIWKFETVLSDLPKNVHILQWAPQTSILSHPNCKLFITHGGLLSTTEAIHFGKPVIGIPVMADQNTNVNIAVQKGFGIRVDLSYTMADDLKEAIEEILSNPAYTEKIKELSFIYHDRPVTPGKELVHWVNHVIRTRGAPHLRSPALLVPWYQKLYLDLLGLLVTSCFLIIYIVRRLIKSIKRQDSKKKKN